MREIRDLIEPFTSMLRRTLGERLHPDARTFVDMMALDGVMEFPYAPPGGVERLEGRAAVSDYIGEIFARIELLEISDPVVHDTEEPGVVILEFEGSSRVIASGRSYRMRYISVITICDGFIARYVDYWNPLTAIVALDQVEAVLSALKEQPHG